VKFFFRLSVPGTADRRNGRGFETSTIAQSHSCPLPPESLWRDFFYFSFLRSQHVGRTSAFNWRVCDKIGYMSRTFHRTMNSWCDRAVKHSKQGKETPTDILKRHWKVKILYNKQKLTPSIRHNYYSFLSIFCCFPLSRINDSIFTKTCSFVLSAEDDSHVYCSNHESPYAV
jgi:hypothetical protein